MSYKIIQGKIEEQDVDIIVNAANACGWMGGLLGRCFKLSGVAESLHYASKGEIEKEAKRISIRQRGKKGDVFVTSGANLKAKHIIHAITMNYPGMKADVDVVEKLIPKILDKARELGAKSIAIPMLGCGTGRISKDKILFLYEMYFSQVQDLEIIVVTF